MSDGTFTHIVLTRFWFRLAANASNAGSAPTPDWFERRCKLFQNYCLPSVLAQSERNFLWLIYFDDCTPEKFLEQLRKIVSPYNNIQVRTCQAYDAVHLKEDVKALVGEATKWVLTTRLDTDDGWHRDFVKRLQQSVQPGTREFLNYPVGIISYRKNAYLYRHASNAFISLSEPVATAATVYCGPHEQLDRLAPIRQLDEFPAFLQVVHSGNLSNKPRGVRVHKILAAQGFEAMPAAFAGTDAEHDASIIIENLTKGVFWTLRDACIQLMKQLLRNRKVLARPK